jgi:ketosteroid isomerase-like protein
VTRPEYYGNPAGITDEIEIVRAIYGAFARRDVDGMLDYLTPDCELWLEGTSRAAGRIGPYRGHDGIRDYFADVERLWDELVLHAEDYRAVPGSVIVIGSVTGRREGLEIRRASVWTWRVQGGRAASCRAADMGELA